MLLTSVAQTPPTQDTFPFNAHAIRALERLTFDAPVTIFVGENGSGKSTLLEAIALAAGMITAGSADADRDDSLNAVRPLADHLKLTWTVRKRRGFFLRAEDFFGFVRRIASMRRALEADLAAADAETRNQSDYARALVRVPYLRELGELQRLYGGDLDAFSHGESFLKFFGARLVAGGLHLLDEPETPLSPTRQLTLLAMIRQMVAQDAQFIIATHSPILMAYPGAAIYSFDYAPPRIVSYDDLEHVTLLRLFLNDPAQFIDRLD